MKLSWTIIMVAFSIAISTSICVNSAEEPFARTEACKGARSVTREELVDALKSARKNPRLLITDERLEETRRKVESDNLWKCYYEALQRRSDLRAKEPPVERLLEGRRLLSVSREALARIFAWSFLYRYLDDPTYAARVEKESLAIAAFSDWNPSHFLDVAEMTTALAIGYDSCNAAFSEESRATIREAIWTHGVLESLKFKGGWKRNGANWNQVCWCGTLYGALAILDDVDAARRELLIDAILDSINGVTWSMASYAPDGNYTEGPGYWAYGTGFNLLLLDALNTTFNDDFGRSSAPGFRETIQYYEHVFGTTGDAFNYPDSGGGKMFEPSAFWFESNDASARLWNERRALSDALRTLKNEAGARPGARSFGSLVGNRLAPCALLWGKVADETQGAPEALGFVGIGNGKCCVALFRTTWSDDGAYLGVKCGAPNSPHGHMDEGGFVYDDLGVRWVVELGPENYHRIESRGMNLWGMNQESDRWKLLRYNNYGHSVPTINGAPQRVSGTTKFIETHIGSVGEPSYAIIDLSPAYDNEIENLTRKTTLEPNGTLVVEDTFKAKEGKDAEIERRFILRNSATLDGRDVVMTQQDPSNPKKLLQKRVTTTSQTRVEQRIIPCETDEEYDSANPNVSILVQTLKLQAGDQTTVTTKFETIKDVAE